MDTFTRWFQKEKITRVTVTIIYIGIILILCSCNRADNLSDKKNEESIGREKIFESNVTKINISTLPPSKGILDNFEITDVEEIDAIKNYFETLHAKETDKDINEYAGMSYLLQLECDGKKAEEINLMGNMFVITGEEIEEAPYEEMVAFDGVLARIILKRYQKDKEITPVIGEVKKIIQKEKEMKRETICMIGPQNRKINITDSYIYNTIQNEGWCDLHKGDRVKLYLKENGQDADAVFIVN